MRYLLGLGLLVFGSLNAFGWGGEGHDVIVRMALRQMKTSERKAVYAPLGTSDPYTIGNWADSIKKFNGTADWHYVDIPDRDEHYNAVRDCSNADCIIAKLGMV